MSSAGTLIGQDLHAWNGLEVALMRHSREWAGRNTTIHLQHMCHQHPPTLSAESEGSNFNMHRVSSMDVATLAIRDPTGTLVNQGSHGNLSQSGFP